MNRDTEEYMQGRVDVLEEISQVIASELRSGEALRTNFLETRTFVNQQLYEMEDRLRNKETREQEALLNVIQGINNGLGEKLDNVIIFRGGN